MSKSEAGKGDAYRSVVQSKWDHGYYLAFGICDQFTCRRKKRCLRYQTFCEQEKSRESYDIRNLVPITKTKDCEWFRPVKEA